MYEQTERLAGPEGIARAAELLRARQIVAFPTETVYGLGADATDSAAVARIYAAKDRPSFNPLIAHVARIEDARTRIDLPEAGWAMAERFWPGPLTLVGPMRAGAMVSDLLTAGHVTLAVRMPDHPLALALIEAAETPLAGPSANPSGRISPTSAGDVLDGLDGRIAAVLDGGACPVGLESTIIGFQDSKPVLLRPGGLAVEDLEALAGPVRQPGAKPGIASPGQLASHYAPAAPVVLDVVEEPVIGFGAVAGEVTLSATGDLAEAAARLFSVLRAADGMVSGRAITVAPIPRHGLGLAINDRLARAAAPRTG